MERKRISTVVTLLICVVFAIVALLLSCDFNAVKVDTAGDGSAKITTLSQFHKLVAFDVSEKPSEDTEDDKITGGVSGGVTSSMQSEKGEDETEEEFKLYSFALDISSSLCINAEAEDSFDKATVQTTGSLVYADGIMYIKSDCTINSNARYELSDKEVKRYTDVSAETEFIADKDGGLSVRVNRLNGAIDGNSLVHDGSALKKWCKGITSVDLLSALPLFEYFMFGPELETLGVIKSHFNNPQNFTVSNDVYSLSAEYFTKAAESVIKNLSKATTITESLGGNLEADLSSAKKPALYLSIKNDYPDTDEEEDAAGGDESYFSMRTKYEFSRVNNVCISVPDNLSYIEPTEFFTLFKGVDND